MQFQLQHSLSGPRFSIFFIGTILTCFPSEQTCRIFLRTYVFQFPPHDHASSSYSLLCSHWLKIYLLALLRLGSELDQIFHVWLQDKKSHLCCFCSYSSEESSTLTQQRMWTQPCLHIISRMISVLFPQQWSFEGITQILKSCVFHI
jgi:hypothetical protein